MGPYQNYWICEMYSLDLSASERDLKSEKLVTPMLNHFQPRNQMTAVFFSVLLMSLPQCMKDAFSFLMNERIWFSFRELDSIIKESTKSTNVLFLTGSWQLSPRVLKQYKSWRPSTCIFHCMSPPAWVLINLMRDGGIGLEFQYSDEW